MKKLIIVLVILGIALLTGCSQIEESLEDEREEYGRKVGNCVLMQDEITGDFGCFGCAGIEGNPILCKDPVPSMQQVEQNSDRCDITSTGCVLKE